MSLEINGTVEEVIFKNDENGYVIAVIDYDDEPLYIKGIMPFISEGEQVHLTGHYVIHKIYGEQFEVENFEIVSPTTLDAIERYLASGLIKGIGPATASRIVEKFGEDSLDIIQYNPEKLLQIAGIGESKLETIVNSFIDQKYLKTVMLFLQKYDISVAYGMKIYKEYAQNSIKYISENPYRLAADIDGIGFKKADEIARKMGFLTDSPYRIESGIRYILSVHINKGHTYLNRDVLVQSTTIELNMDKDSVEDVLNEMIINGEVFFTIIYDEEVVFPLYLYNAEKSVFTKMMNLYNSPYEFNDIDVDDIIDEYEKYESIKLDEIQALAVKKVMDNGVMVVTGGPGTGKTTIIKAIIRVFEQSDLSVILAAPTGRASKRMSEATGREAKTIHRLLEYSFVEGQSRFNRNSDNPLTADVVIIDEMSMVDIVLMDSLLNAITIGTRLILVGDVDQLPSVGSGNVLRDIIESKIIYTIRLKEIFRQSYESVIVSNAHRINRGESPELNIKDGDFYFINRASNVSIAQTIVELCKERLPNHYNLDPTLDIQVLSPMKNSEIGTINLNKVLQETLNPKSDKKAEKVFSTRIYRVGDKVMQIKNNYEIEWTMDGEFGVIKGKGVYNGDIGVVSHIDNKDKSLEVLFDDGKITEYSFDELDQIVLAYAVTVHKSQGSEFRVVVMPISYGAPLLLSRNVLYTAITRAKELVVLVGDTKYLMRMINNNHIGKRNSALGYFFNMYRTELEKLE